MRVAARERAARPAVNTRNREVVTDTRNAGPTGIAYELLEPVHLLPALRTVQKDVVPELGREVLYRGELKPRLTDVRNELGEFIVAPQRIGGAIAPAEIRAAAANLRVRPRKVARQVGNNVCRTRLDGKV